jgi:hypothetical protein
MQIGIVGSGRIGARLGTLWAASGHEVMFSFSRDPGKLRSLAAAAGPMGEAGTPAEAAAFGQVLLLAVPYPELDAVLAEINVPPRTVVIDATNPFTREYTVVDLGAAGSAGKALAARLPEVRVVKAFNTLPAEVYDSPDRENRLALFLCGDDADARRVVAGLVRDAGFAPVDAGPISAASIQEPGGPRYNAAVSASEASLLVTR